MSLVTIEAALLRRWADIIEGELRRESLNMSGEALGNLIFAIRDEVAAAEALANDVVSISHDLMEFWHDRCDLHGDCYHPDVCDLIGECMTLYNPKACREMGTPPPEVPALAEPVDTDALGQFLAETAALLPAHDPVLPPEGQDADPPAWIEGENA